MCEQIKSEFHHKRTCDNLKEIVKNESKQLTKLTTLINTLYKTRTNGRRGLIDGIGGIAKTLFGTMDANDRELINEQLNLLQNNQQTIQHVAKNQIKILNSTIVHLDKLENILDHNGKLLNHYVREYSTREEITEHFTVIIAMIADLIRDAKDVIEYLTYVRKGTMHPVLTPISDIITHLKEAAIQLPHGLYFPFEIRNDEWLALEEYIKITAYREGSIIFTVLRFPLISQPVYDIIKVTPLPTYDHKNIFTHAEINHEIIAVNREGLTYIIITEDDLKKCIQRNSRYISEKTQPIHRINPNAPCEIQMYLQPQNQNEACKSKHVIATETIWIPLQQPRTWLYSTVREQSIIIQCENCNEIRKVIKGTGQITLQNKCKLITTEMTIQPKEVIQGNKIETYLPEINITFIRDNTDILDTKQQNIVQHSELTELKNKLKDINNDLQNTNDKFFTKKQFVYPMATSGITTIIIIILIIYIIIKNKKKHTKRPSVRIYEEDEPCMSYGFPRPILKRSLSTRF